MALKLGEFGWSLHGNVVWRWLVCDHGPKFAQGKAPQAYGWYWSAFPRFCAAGTSRSCASMLR